MLALRQYSGREIKSTTVELLQTQSSVFSYLKNRLSEVDVRICRVMLHTCIPWIDKVLTNYTSIFLYWVGMNVLLT